MRRRYVLKRKERFFGIVLFFIIMLFSIFLVVSAKSYKPDSYTYVTVGKGDTLWDISTKYAINCDVRDFIRNIKQLNNLDGNIIYEGDILIIPQN